MQLLVIHAVLTDIWKWLLLSLETMTWQYFLRSSYSAPLSFQFVMELETSHCHGTLPFRVWALSADLECYLMSHWVSRNLGLEIATQLQHRYTRVKSRALKTTINVLITSEVLTRSNKSTILYPIAWDTSACYKTIRVICYCSINAKIVLGRYWITDIMLFLQRQNNKLRWRSKWGNRQFYFDFLMFISEQHIFHQ